MAKAQMPGYKSANLTPEQMQAVLPKLDRRIRDLESFDPSLIKKRYDPLIDTLEKKVNGTLQEIFGLDTVEYKDYYVDSFDPFPLRLPPAPPYPLAQVQQRYKEEVDRCLQKIKTLKEILEERIADTPPPIVAPNEHMRSSKPISTRVFVVHGHDDGVKEMVARFLIELELEPLILHEQANQNKTIIEKIEAHANVAYAVVLLTPDDEGHPAGHPEETRPRARQNVVLELGYFMAKLGRSQVCVLYKGDVEIPSDYKGVLYVQFDDHGAWKLQLAKEMKSVGIEIDLNKLSKR